MAELLRVEGFSAGYGEARVIQGIDFALEDGRSLALLGRNGVGKTTLIDTLVGVTTRFAGKIWLGGADITPLSPARPRPGRDRLDAAGAQHLPLADGRGEPDRRRRPGPWTVAARLRPVSAPARSGAPTAAGSFRAASSRCWRSAAR